MDFSFPLWFLLIPYVLFLVIAAVFLFLNLFHIARFGLQAIKTTMLLGLYILSFLAVLTVTSLTLASFDWSEQIESDEIFSPASTIFASDL